MEIRDAYKRLSTMESEDIRLLPLALVGISIGLYREFIRPEITRDRVAFVGGLVLGSVVANILTDND